MENPSIRFDAIRRKVAPFLLAHRNWVRAVYIGRKTTGGVRTGQIALVVHVAEKRKPQFLLNTDEFWRRFHDWTQNRFDFVDALPTLPEILENILLTDVVEQPRSFQFVASQTLVTATIPNREKFRPKIPAGASMIKEGSTACSFTGWALKGGAPVMVVAAHCGYDFIACQDAQVGDYWVQPSPMDAQYGSPERVGVIRTRPVPFLDKRLDALILEPLKAEYYTHQIVGQGLIEGKVYASELQEGETIYKSGRTTGPGSGEFINPRIDANVDSPCGTVSKTGWALARLNLEGGDSGDPATAVRAGKRLIFGLWNAGDGTYALACPIEYVEQAYGVDFNISKLPENGETPPPPPPAEDTCEEEFQRKYQREMQKRKPNVLNLIRYVIEYYACKIGWTTTGIPFENRDYIAGILALISTGALILGIFVGVALDRLALLGPIAAAAAAWYFRGRSDS